MSWVGESWVRARCPLIIATAVGLLSFGSASAQDSPACSAPKEVTRLALPLHRTAARIAAREPLKIVALGSSSTAGAGASSPAFSYPNRLAVELQRLFPGRPITVVNQGVNGEEVNDMLARFETSVMAEKPDLVLWQVGTNTVLRSSPLATANILIREGVRRLKAAGADVVLIDPQFAPKVIAKPEAEVMVGLLSSAAKEANVDVFQRYAAMRYWHEDEDIPFSAFITPDELHMNDWGYSCIAKLLGGAIAEAANRARTPAAVARPLR